MDILVNSETKKARRAAKGREDRRDIFMVILLYFKRQPTDSSISEV